MHPINLKRPTQKMVLTQSSLIIIFFFCNDCKTGHKNVKGCHYYVDRLFQKALSFRHTRVSPRVVVSVQNRVSPGLVVSVQDRVSPGVVVSVQNRVSPGEVVSIHNRVSPGVVVSIHTRVSNGVVISIHLYQSVSRVLVSVLCCCPPTTLILNHTTFPDWP